MALSQVHRSTLKQKNKRHNVLGHRTKGQVTAQSKGRVAAKEISKKHKNELSRDQRKLQAKQIRAHKREEVMFKKRMIGSGKAAPFLVTIIPLSPSISGQRLIDDLSQCDPCITSCDSPQGLKHISCPRFKQRFSFIAPPIHDLHSILDCVKVSTNIIFIWKAETELSESTNLLLSTLAAQGLPSTLHVVSGLEELSTKKRNFALKELQREVFRRFPDHPKLHSLARMQDVFLLLRQIGVQKQCPLFYRDQRSHLIAEKVVFEESENKTSGTMKLYGYIRGQPLSSNSLMHIPGYGEYQISRIEAVTDPYSLEGTKRSPLQQFEDETRLLEEPDPELQESLITVNNIDSMEGEQTWPTEEELRESEKRKYEPKRVPKGTSDYQAAWILDDDENDSLVGDLEDFSDHSSQIESICDSPTQSDDDCTEGDDSQCDADEYDEGVDYASEMTFLEKIKAAKDDAEFPDETDTPMDIPAKLRFQKFRGLQSFRTSYWDPKENLPLDYQRIFQFKNYDHSRKRILKAENEGVFVGWYTCIHLIGIEKYIYKENLTSGAAVVAFSLLPHEQKVSVLNVLIKSNPIGHTNPIKAKEKLIFHVGCRRFANTPIFSEHSTGNKHKFTRFFQPGDTTVASMFAPITFSPCPVSVFKQFPDGAHDLVATGSVLSMDPNRIICKRVVLSGHPFKVNRKSAVVRYLFFNSDDVNYFKPVELRTKWGRRGHIKEPLGTHGHMKCVFNGQLKSQDTVLMNLYKRVFPKLENYNPHINTRHLLLAARAPQHFEGETDEEPFDLKGILPCSKRKKVQFLVS